MIGADTETFPIRHRATAPRLVCLTAYDGHDHLLVGNGDPYLQDAIEELLKEQSSWHNAAYDMAVICKNFPNLIPLVVAALDEGRVFDTKIQEKLCVLAHHGNMRLKPLPNGEALPILYDLASLTRRWLKKERSEGKGSQKDAMRASHYDEEEEEARGDLWRYNFDALDGWRGVEYPHDAAEYAKEDAQDAHDVCLLQHEELVRLYGRQGLRWQPEVAALHVASDFFLYYTSSHGVHIDLAAVEKLRLKVTEDLSEDKLQELIMTGIMRPAEASHPWRKRHEVDCRRKKVKDPKTGEKVWACECAWEWTQPKEASIDTKILQALVRQVCEENDHEVKLTPTGNVSCDAEVMSEVSALHPALGRYKYRQSKIKILQVEIPRMSASVIHPHYNGLISSGRVSCSATKLYPSGNLQNVDPRARSCYVVPDWQDWLLYLADLNQDAFEAPFGPHDIYLCSVDYGAMELVTLAQRVYDQFGHSTLRDQLNAGVDPHAFLGAQIALALSPEFRDHCKEVGAVTRDQQYAEFVALKKEPDGTPARDFYDEYRTMAKPTGLGYPGGLGPLTFIAFARGQYDVRVTLETATLLREIWHETYPEMRGYFERFNREQKDPDNSREFQDKRTGEQKWKQTFWYQTPGGMLRRGCTYTEGVNGFGLQSPGAELAKHGLCRVGAAAYDRTQGSILWGRCRPAGFVHDEILSYVLADGHETEVAKEKARLMVEGGQRIVPDVLLKAEPCFMLAWDKRAKPVFKDGKLVPWLPPAEEEK